MLKLNILFIQIKMLAFAMPSPAFAIHYYIFTLILRANETFTIVGLSMFTGHYFNKINCIIIGCNYVYFSSFRFIVGGARVVRDGARE